MSIESGADLIALRKIGRIVANCLPAMGKALESGMTARALDKVERKYLEFHGARPAPQLSYNFPGTTCISVNEEAAHGIPGNKILRASDLVNIDVSAELDGYFADTGGSFIIPQARTCSKKEAFLASYKLAPKLSNPGAQSKVLAALITLFVCLTFPKQSYAGFYHRPFGTEALLEKTKRIASYSSASCLPDPLSTEVMMKLEKIRSEGRLQEALWYLNDLQPKTDRIKSLSAQYTRELRDILEKTPCDSLVKNDNKTTTDTFKLKRQIAVGNTTPTLKFFFKPCFSLDKSSGHFGLRANYIDQDCENEVATSVIDQYLDLNMAPMTVFRECRYGKEKIRGALRVYIPSGKDESGEIKVPDSFGGDPKEFPIYVRILDCLIGNSDRSSLNPNMLIYLDPDRKLRVVAIDHNLTFRGTQRDCTAEIAQEPKRNTEDACKYVFGAMRRKTRPNLDKSEVDDLYDPTTLRVPKDLIDRIQSLDEQTSRKLLTPVYLDPVGDKKKDSLDLERFGEVVKSQNYISYHEEECKGKYISKFDAAIQALQIGRGILKSLDPDSNEDRIRAIPLCDRRVEAPCQTNGQVAPTVLVPRSLHN